MTRMLPCDLSGSLVLSRRAPLMLSLFLIAAWAFFRARLPWSFTAVMAAAIALLLFSWVHWPRASSLEDLALRTSNELQPGALPRMRVVSALIALPLLIVCLVLLSMTLMLGDWRATGLLISLGSFVLAFCAVATTGKLHARLLRDAQIPLLLLNSRLATSVLAMTYAVSLLLLYIWVLALS